MEEKLSIENFDLEFPTTEHEEDALIKDLQPSPNVINNLIENKGFFCLHLWFCLISSVCFFSNLWYQISFYGINLQPIKSHFKVTNLDIMILILISYVFMGVSALLIKYPISVFGRRYVIYFCMVFGNLASCWGIFWTNFFAFSMTRIVALSALGGIEPVMQELLDDFLPHKSRGYIRTVLNIFKSIAFIISTIFLLSLAPELRGKNFGFIVIYLNAFSFASSIACLLFLRESAVALIMEKRNTEAFELLTENYDVDLNEETKILILHQVSLVDFDKNMDLVTFEEIFKPKFKRQTILLIFTRIILTANIIGPLCIFQDSLIGIHSLQPVFKKHLIVYCQMLIAIGGTFGYTMFGLLGEIKVFGRVLTLIITCALMSSFSLFFIFFKLYFGIVFAIYYMLVLGVDSLNLKYISDIYPSYIRKYALFFINVCNYIGGILGVLAYFSMNMIGTMAPFYYLIVSSLFVTILFSFFTDETETYRKKNNRKY